MMAALFISHFEPLHAWSILAPEKKVFHTRARSEYDACSWNATVVRIMICLHRETNAMLLCQGILPMTATNYNFFGFDS